MSGKRLPTHCPSCGQLLHVVRLGCTGCSTTVEGDYALPLLAHLPMEDLTFVLNFLKSGGSLKDLARLYEVSYPTVRNRLDALIDKIKLFEAEGTERKEV